MSPRRYKPTKDEIAALEAKGWRCTTFDAEDVWFWPPNTYGRAWTYKEAVKEQARRDNEPPRTIIFECKGG